MGRNQLRIESVDGKDGQMRITGFPGENELGDPAVHGIVEDLAGNLWISTGNGITCIDRLSGKAIQYTSRNGLQNDEFSDGAYFRDNEMDVFFGGVAGFSYFNPEEMRLRNFEPEIRLAGLRINNKELNVYDRVKTNVLNLTYDEAHVSLTFCVGDLINNENCVFAYRIADFQMHGSTMEATPPFPSPDCRRVVTSLRCAIQTETVCGVSQRPCSNCMWGIHGGSAGGLFSLISFCRHLSQLSSIQSFATESG